MRYARVAIALLLVPLVVQGVRAQQAADLRGEHVGIAITANQRRTETAFGALRTYQEIRMQNEASSESFNVARAYDEAKGIAHPVIWTAERDREMWAALQG